MAGVCGVPAENGVLMSFPERFDTTSISTAISTLQNADICTGNYDQHFIDLALKRGESFFLLKGNLWKYWNQQTAYSVVNGQEMFMTVRHLQHELLLMVDLLIL